MKNVEDILCDLINIRTDNVNNSNKEIVEYICQILKNEHVLYYRLRAKDGIKENLVAVIGASRLKNIRGLVLSGHMDTVPANEKEWETSPFRATIADGKIYGRGAVDMKFFIACVLSIIPQIKNTELPVILSFSCDEETHVHGIKEICAFFKENNIFPQFALVGEPTDFNLRVGHKGYYGFTTNIKGKSAHSSHPERGINAIFAASHIISEIEKLSRFFSNQDTTLNVGFINGGEQRNSIPSEVSFDWEIRSFNEKPMQTIISKIKKYHEEIQKKYPGLQINVIAKEIMPVFEQRKPGKLHRLASNILKTQDVTSFSATEAGFLQKEGIETLICGVTCSETAHTAYEHIKIADLEKYKNFLKELIFALNK